MKDDIINRGMFRFDYDLFVLVGCIAMYGRVGCSLRGLLGLTYRDVSSSSFRGLQYKLSSLISFGYVVKTRRGNSVRYSISSHAEKLIIKSIGRDALRDMALLVKEALKA